MNNFQIIQSLLQQTARRRRWQRAWRGLWQGLFLGCAIWAALVGLFKILPIPEAVLSAGAILTGFCMLAGLLMGWWRKSSLEDTARWMDSQQNLQERLSTALEVKSRPVSGNWRDLLLTDAAKHVQKLDVTKLLPYHLPKVSRWALLVLILGVGLGFVPEYRSKQYVQKKREVENIRETGKQMAEFVRHNLDKKPPVMEPVRKAVESVSELGDFLAKAKLTRSDALKDLASVTDKIQQQAKELTKNPALKRMEQAARTPSGNSESSNAALQKKIDELQKSLGAHSGNPDALEKLKNDLQKLKEAASGLSSSDSAKADAARQRMADALASLSQKAQDLGASLPGLEAAIEALKANQTDLFLKDLDLALNDLEKMKEMAKALQQLQQQAEQMGKNLAEQLKLGQAELAQANLEKMVEQLKSASLSPEDLKKILDEVAQAVDPANPYGKVADLLKQSVQQMQQGQKSGAAQSLADAAKELEKLLEQLGDAQSLMASLEALQRAQMCIGNCKGWGQCKASFPRFGKGGKPGPGVGTWADENSGWYNFPPSADMWDNSGVVRPDMAARGQTDRGEGELPDNLAPTKVKGQFTPGGSMPSITLKGVSIKGQSTVAYQEAVVAAQSDAQSALSQEQVPRAYQGAVRDYFDDLKK